MRFHSEGFVGASLDSRDSSSGELSSGVSSSGCDFMNSGVHAVYVGGLANVANECK